MYAHSKGDPLASMEASSSGMPVSPATTPAAKPSQPEAARVLKPEPRQRTPRKAEPIETTSVKIKQKKRTALLLNHTAVLLQWL